jgi:3-phosphoshikimate 1-carboxyvinyltransferase
MNGQKVVFTGSETLLKRPLDVYKSICDKQNIVFNNDGKQLTIEGELSGGDYKIPGNISSQFISGLLFALPLLEGDSTINIVPPIESLSYINLTIQALGEFGVDVKWVDERTIYIKGNQRYLPHEVWVEGDYSNAAFFAAMDHLAGDVEITGLNEKSIQGDRVYKRLFEQLLKGTPAINISDCPDLGPIMMAFAAAKSGGVFTGTRRLKIKESDRGAAMAEELSKFGVSVKVEEDTIVVYPIDFHKPEVALEGHNDHRIVMSLCVLLMLTGGSIRGIEAVNKSMPDFFEKLEQLGVDFKYETV